MPEAVLVGLWLVGGSLLAWFLLTRLQGWLGQRLARLDQASRAPDDDERANDLVRVWGFGVAASGAAFLTFGAGWAIAGVVPLQLFGLFGAAFGAWMFTFPAKYRELRRRSGR
jgi:fatty acid desaturase